jgi:hypothetical protein
MRSPFRFPNPVNETSARLVAGGVVVQCLAFVVFRQDWQLALLAYGFVARVAAGPTFSPLGQAVTRLVTPRIRTEHRFVPGPPKRFAQGMGATMSSAALVAALTDHPTLALVLVLAIVVAATLESVFAFCLGCVVFNRLMAWGVIPPDVCEACNDLSLRWSRGGGVDDARSAEPATN